MIYFIRCDYDTENIRAGWIKIGFTSHLTMRFRQIAVDIGHKPTILGVIDGTISDERALHERFMRLRMFKEWFRPHRDLRRFIKEEGKSFYLDTTIRSVRLDAELVTMARYVAAKRGVTISDLIAGWLRPIVEREFHKEGKKLMDDDSKPGKK